MQSLHAYLPTRSINLSKTQESAFGCTGTEATLEKSGEPQGEVGQLRLILAERLSRLAPTLPPNTDIPCNFMVARCM
jgi:hypothetical protein